MFSPIPTGFPWEKWKSQIPDSDLSSHAPKQVLSLGKLNSIITQPTAIYSKCFMMIPFPWMLPTNMITKLQTNEHNTTIPQEPSLGETEEARKIIKHSVCKWVPIWSMEQLSKVAFSDKFSTIKDENPTDRQNSVKKSCFAKQCTARSASYCNNGSDEPRECKLCQVLQCRV